MNHVRAIRRPSWTKCESGQSVTGLQELQDRAEEAGSLSAYINGLLPPTENLATASLCLEWDSGSSELRVVKSTDKRAGNCLQFGHLLLWREF